MHIFTLKAATLVAINKYAASSEEVRYYLNGVCLDIANGSGVMVATDGHRLLASSFETGAADGKFIIPRPLISKLKISRRSNTHVDVKIDGDRVTLDFDGETFGGNLIDGTFPDWRRVIPRDVSGEVAQFNGAYLKDADDAGKLAGIGRATIGHNGTGPAWLVYPTPELFGAIMPIRAKTDIYMPGWVVDAPKSAEVIQIPVAA